jgi:hypothetical protein
LRPDLAVFQRRFAEAIDRPATGPLAVYRNTVIHGAVEALASNYPVIQRLIGNELFEAAGADFATAFPPRSPTLALYGESFPEWLTGQPWADELPYLGDVAQVERMHVECLFAKDAEPLSQEQARIECRRPGARIRLHPALRFAWLRTPAMTIWLAHQRPMDGELEPEWKAEGALFARPTPFVMHALRIGPAAHRILCGLRLGESVAAALGAASNLYPDEDSTAVFPALVNLGAFAAPSTERI